MAQNCSKIEVVAVYGQKMLTFSAPETPSKMKAVYWDIGIISSKLKIFEKYLIFFSFRTRIIY